MPRCGPTTLLVDAGRTSGSNVPAPSPVNRTVESMTATSIGDCISTIKPSTGGTSRRPPVITPSSTTAPVDRFVRTYSTSLLSCQTEGLVNRSSYSASDCTRPGTTICRSIRPVPVVDLSNDPTSGGTYPAAGA